MYICFSVLTLCYLNRFFFHFPEKHIARRIQNPSDFRSTEETANAYDLETDGNPSNYHASKPFVRLQSLQNNETDTVSESGILSRSDTQGLIDTSAKSSLHDSQADDDVKLPISLPDAADCKDTVVSSVVVLSKSVKTLLTTPSQSKRSRSSMSESVERPFPCSVCGKSFKRKFHMTEHVKTVHSKDGGKFHCTICERTFTRRHGLNQHLEMHANSHKKFPCKICFRKFSRRSDATRHEAIHFAKDANTGSLRMPTTRDGSCV